MIALFPVVCTTALPRASSTFAVFAVAALAVLLAALAVLVAALAVLTSAALAVFTVAAFVVVFVAFATQATWLGS